MSATWTAHIGPGALVVGAGVPDSAVALLAVPSTMADLHAALASCDVTVVVATDSGVDVLVDCGPAIEVHHAGGSTTLSDQPVPVAVDGAVAVRIAGDTELRWPVPASSVPSSVTPPAPEPAPAPTPAAATPTSAAPPSGGLPFVEAVRCPAGHPNPTQMAACRLCGTAIADHDTIDIPRPILARLYFSTGLLVDVDRPVLLGRRPAPDLLAQPVTEPHGLVSLPSDDKHLSRMHGVVGIVGWDLTYTDNASGNGSRHKRPGGDWAPVDPHTPVPLVVGSEVVLADTVSFRVDPPAM